MSQALAVEKRQSCILEFQEKNPAQTVSVCRNAVWEEGESTAQPDETRRHASKGSGSGTRHWGFPGQWRGDMVHF